MSTPSADEFERKVLHPGLSVNSGVYSAIDPSIRMRLNERGEYEYFGATPDWYSPRAEQLLAVSAFGTSESEASIADRLFPTAEGTRTHPVIGNYRSLTAGFVAEGDFRERGSSGGLTSWLLTELLETGLIDAVVHMVPTPNENTLFGYRISTSSEGIAGGSKSRYYPGELSSLLAGIVESGKRYAVTAIPSIAYEIRLLQRADPRYGDAIRFVIGLVCGHQKTANYAKQLAWRAGILPSELTAIDFRSKDPETGANRYRAEVTGLREGREVITHIRQGSIDETDWGLGMFKSNFSDYTEDAFNETADAVFGDAWLPEYVGESSGTNIAIVRSRALDDIIQEARRAGRLHLDDLSENQVLNSQAALVTHSVREVAARFRILRSRSEYTPAPRRPDEMPRVSLLRREIQKVRIDLSRVSHEAWIAASEAGDIRVFDERMAPLVDRYRRLQKLIRLSRKPKNALLKLKRRLTTSG